MRTLVQSKNVKEIVFIIITSQGSPFWLSSNLSRLLLLSSDWIFYASVTEFAVVRCMREQDDLSIVSLIPKNSSLARRDVSYTFSMHVHISRVPQRY
jgi:hypothetical protein